MGYGVQERDNWGVHNENPKQKISVKCVFTNKEVPAYIGPFDNLILMSAVKSSSHLPEDGIPGRWLPIKTSLRK